MKRAHQDDHREDADARERRGDRDRPDDVRGDEKLALQQQRIAAVVRAGFKPTPAKRRPAGGASDVHYALVNGAPALLFVVSDRVAGVVTFDLADGRIATVRGIAAPARLARLAETWRRHARGTPLIAQW